MPSLHRDSYARAKVEAHERIEGGLSVYYKGECSAHQPAPIEAPVLRARKGPRAVAHTQTDAPQRDRVIFFLDNNRRERARQGQRLFTKEAKLGYYRRN